MKQEKYNRLGLTLTVEYGGVSILVKAMHK